MLKKILAFLTPLGGYTGEILVMLAIAFVFWGGYRTKTAVYEIHAAETQAIIIKNYKNSQDFINAVSAAYQMGHDSGAKQVKDTHAALTEARKVRPATDCALSPDEVKAVNE